MNKKVFSKLALLLLSISLVSCGDYNNQTGKSNSSKSSTSQSISSTESNTVESNEKDKDIPKNTQQETNPDVKQNTTPERFNVAGGTNNVEGVIDYYLSELNVKERIEPSYDVKTEGNVFIDVVLGINNLNNENIKAEDIISARIKINSNEYKTFSLAESDDGTSLESSPSIKALEDRYIHYVAEVPIKDSIGELEVILTINGKDYSNKFNLNQNQ